MRTAARRRTGVESPRSAIHHESGRAGYVTIIANYEPLQDPAGGPNFYQLDPNALYEISIDNTADGKEDLTFQFRFANSLSSGAGLTVPGVAVNLGTIFDLVGALPAPGLYATSWLGGARTQSSCG